MVLDNSSELKNSLSKSGRYKGIIPPKHKTLLEYLFSLLDTDEELNPVLSGYFFTVVDALFRRNSEKVSSYFFSH